MTMRFRDRREAGRNLARKLQAFAGRGDLLVLALPRGGVPVAYEVAQALRAPLDVFVVRKLGVPGHEELAMGAVASGGNRVLNTDVVRQLDIDDATIRQVAESETRELKRREQLYRGNRPLLKVRDRTVLLIDDGLATGSTMRAAARALRQMAPGQLVIAVPVAPPETCDDLRRECDQIICSYLPDPFYAVGLWYSDFTQTTDEEVYQLLRSAPREGQVNLPYRADNAS